MISASLELPGLEFLPLDFAASAAVEQARGVGVNWRHAHEVYAAVFDIVDGQVLSAVPETYDGTGLWVGDIGKP